MILPFGNLCDVVPNLNADRPRSDDLFDWPSGDRLWSLGDWPPLAATGPTIFGGLLILMMALTRSIIMVAILRVAWSLIVTSIAVSSVIMAHGPILIAHTRRPVSCVLCDVANKLVHRPSNHRRVVTRVVANNLVQISSNSMQTSF